MFKYILFAFHFSALRFGPIDPMIFELIREDNRRAEGRFAAQASDNLSVLSQPKQPVDQDEELKAA